MAPHLGAALRRRIISPAALEQVATGAERAAGVLSLDAELRRRSSTPSIHAWLAVLPGATIAESHGYLPPAVYAVAARASAAACPSVRGLPARLRTRTTDGRWAVIEAAPLDEAEVGKVGVA